MDDPCRVCNFYTKKNVYYLNKKIDDRAFLIDCYRCGRYIISEQALTSFPNYINNERKKSNLSGWIRENQNYVINYSDLEKLSGLSIPPVGERANKLLLYMTKKFPNIGSNFSRNRIYKSIQALNSPDEQRFNKIDASQLVPMLSISWSLDWNELEFLLDDYLWKEKGYIDTSTTNIIKITPKGWAFIDELLQTSSDSQIAFIAIKFDDDLIQYSKNWIEKGILDARYEPKALYDHQHNNIIDDEMIALIRRCKFIVTDLTKKSLGAYYEAGFGHGAGKDVIFLCKKSYFQRYKKDIHFDINHRPIILWNEDNGRDLRKKLKDRIESTIGLGNYKPSN